MRIQLNQMMIARFSMETFLQQLADTLSCWKFQQAGPPRDSVVYWKSGESTERIKRHGAVELVQISFRSLSFTFFVQWRSIIQMKIEVKGFARICQLPLCYQFLFMYSLYSVAGYGFCMLVPMIEIDYSSSQCIPWSWDCCLEDCRDLSLPIKSSALKNCIWMKRIFNFND